MSQSDKLAAHTPGPWSTNDVIGGGHVVLREGRNARGLHRVRLDDNGKFSEADARLIAAAPALLAAARSLVDALRPLADHGHLGDVTMAGWRAARDAIAKAEAV